MNILIKFSGEFFTEKDELTANGAMFVEQMKFLDLNACYFVVGGGNRLRGKNSLYERNAADNIGVLSTLMNAFILSEYLRRNKISSVVFSHFNDFGEKYDPLKAMKKFKKGNCVILSTGLGRVGYVSTDLSAVIKALELKVDALIKVTKVDSLYDNDPTKDIAKPLNFISHKEILKKRLSIMDLSSLEIAFENDLSIGICSIKNFVEFINKKDKIGTIIGKDFRK